MRLLTIVTVAAFFALPAAAPAQACGAGQHSAKAATADYSAAKKKSKKPKNTVLAQSRKANKKLVYRAVVKLTVATKATPKKAKSSSAKAKSANRYSATA